MLSKMENDEQAIRQLVNKWMNATKAGDISTVLTLMADDVLFLVPGREPFGKDLFAAGARAMRDLRIEGTSDIQELHIHGDWAWMRNHLSVTITPANGASTRRSGYTLTVLRKQPDGEWVVARDANLLS
jgi:uncharacterized protein (TIGR02246 family)